MSIGKKILLLRRKIGLSQAEIALLLKISQSSIGHYEKCVRRPSVDIAIKLVSLANKHGLDATLEDFLIG